MNRPELRRLAWGAYGVAFLMIAIPLLDSLLGVWPLRVGEVTWRFGAVGLFSRAVMTPVFGLLLALATAIYMEHRVTTRILSILGFAGALLALVAIGFFTLDALQTRASVRPEAAGAFDTASAVAVVKYLLGLVVTTALAVGGWKASRKSTGRESAGETGSVLVSSKEATPPA